MAAPALQTAAAAAEQEAAGRIHDALAQHAPAAHVRELVAQPRAALVERAQPRALERAARLVALGEPALAGIMPTLEMCEPLECLCVATTAPRTPRTIAARHRREAIRGAIAEANRRVNRRRLFAGPGDGDGSDGSDGGCGSDGSGGSGDSLPDAAST